MRPVLAVAGCAAALSWSAVAAAAPLRIAVASFAGDWRGDVAADELAERLALVPGVAATERDHVRAAEAGGSPGLDATRLGELGRRLAADLVIGGRVDGERVAATVVETGSGTATPLPDGRGRPDRAAIALAQAVLAARHLEAPPALARSDGSDAAYVAWGRAQAAADHGRLDEARQALAHAPRSARSEALAAHLLLQARDPAGAVERARQARTLGDGVAIRLMLARSEDWAGHDGAAIDAYRAVLALAPHHAVAHSNLGRLLTQRHDPAAAAELAAAVAAEPAWTLPAYNLALDDLAHGRDDAAARALQKLHEIDPKSAEFAVALGRAWRRAERPGAAVPLLRQVVTERPADAGARAELALALAETGQPEEALTLLAAAGTTAPVLRVARARVLLAKGALDDAATALTATAPSGVAADRRQAQQVLALVRLAQHRPADAAALLKTVVDEDPGDGQAQYDLGLALHDGGDRTGAQTALRAALAAEPGRTAVALALATLALEGGDAGGARAILGPAHASHPDDARLALALGVAEFRAGQPARAAEVLARAAASERRETAVEASYDLCEALLAAHRRDDARAAARRYLAVESRPGHEAQRARARQIAE